MHQIVSRVWPLLSKRAALIGHPCLVGCGLHHHQIVETILDCQRNSPVAKQARTNLNSNEKPIAWVPATIAAVIAIAGTAGLMFVVLASEQIPEYRGAGMRSAAAAYLAGATITPTSPASDVAPR